MIFFGLIDLRSCFMVVVVEWRIGERREKEKNEEEDDEKEKGRCGWLWRENPWEEAGIFQETSFLSFFRLSLSSYIYSVSKNFIAFLLFYLLILLRTLSFFSFFFYLGVIHLFYINLFLLTLFYFNFWDKILIHSSHKDY